MKKSWELMSLCLFFTNCEDEPNKNFRNFGIRGSLRPTKAGRCSPLPWVCCFNRRRSGYRMQNPPEPAPSLFLRNCFSEKTAPISSAAPARLPNSLCPAPSPHTTQECSTGCLRPRVHQRHCSQPLVVYLTAASVTCRDKLQELLVISYFSGRCYETILRGGK